MALLSALEINIPIFAIKEKEKKNCENKPWRK